MTARKKMKKLWTRCLGLCLNEAAVEEFLRGGGDLNVVYSKTTLLCEACRSDQIDTAKFLLEKGANIDQVDSFGSSPVCIAASHGYDALVDLLISEGADINLTNKNRYTPLLSALQNDHLDVALKLIAAGANVNIIKATTYQETEYPVTLISMALVDKGRWSISEALIKAGAMPVKFECPIDFLVIEDLQVDLAELLISAGFHFYVEHWVEQVKNRDQEEVSNREMDLLRLIEEDHKNVRSLQSHCRVAIRCRIVEMGRQIHLDKLIDELPLPMDVKKYVKLEYL